MRHLQLLPELAGGIDVLCRRPLLNRDAWRGANEQQRENEEGRRDADHQPANKLIHEAEVKRQEKPSAAGIAFGVGFPPRLSGRSFIW